MIDRKAWLLERIGWWQAGHEAALAEDDTVAAGAIEKVVASLERDAALSGATQDEIMLAKGATAWRAA